MSTPETEMHELIKYHRRLAETRGCVLVPSTSLLKLLDYIRKLENDIEEAGWDAMGEDL